MIEVYGRDGCSFCDKAVEALNQYNRQYNYFKLNEDLTVSEFQERFPGQKTVPVIVANGFKVGGYTELLGYLEETAGGYGE